MKRTTIRYGVVALCNLLDPLAAMAFDDSSAAMVLSSAAVHRPPGSATARNDVVPSLQLQHPPKTPDQVFESLSEACRRLDVTEWDVYGDRDKDPSQSFLRQFEQEVLKAFVDTRTTASDSSLDEQSANRFQDAVFMPSGVMAQSIALLIHHRDRCGQPESAYPPPRFACHSTSHLLLHEEQAYRELLNMEAVVLFTLDDTPSGSLETPPLTLETVQRQLGDAPTDISTLILEVPHRELGGKLTPWEDIQRLGTYCRQHNIRFHCDGARIFEASAGYDGVSLAELVSPFDSLYISFYKGLGGLSGAMLLGSQDFCAQARIWLRRLGGNLNTLLPYAVSGWAGFRRQWLIFHDSKKGTLEEPDSASLLSFVEKKNRLVDIVGLLSSDPAIAAIVTFDPAIPQINMVHGYLLATPEECQRALDAVQEHHGIRVLIRVCPVTPSREPAYSLGYRSFFEWTMGEYNGNIPDDCYLRGWKSFAQELSSKP